MQLTNRLTKRQTQEDKVENTLSDADKLAIELFKKDNNFSKIPICEGYEDAGLYIDQQLEWTCDVLEPEQFECFDFLHLTTEQIKNIVLHNNRSLFHNFIVPPPFQENNYSNPNNNTIAMTKYASLHDDLLG